MGKKKHNNLKFINKVIKPLEQNGFTCDSRNYKFLIGKGDGPYESWHSGYGCFHSLRRWLKTEYKFDIEENKYLY